MMKAQNKIANTPEKQSHNTNKDILFTKLESKVVSEPWKVKSMFLSVLWMMLFIN